MYSINTFLDFIKAPIWLAYFKEGVQKEKFKIVELADLRDYFAFQMR